MRVSPGRHWLQFRGPTPKQGKSENVSSSQVGEVLVFGGPSQIRPFCLSKSCVLKVLVFIGPDQNSPRNYANFMINKKIASDVMSGYSLGRVRSVDYPQPVRGCYPGTAG
jgi:hypothetical protein